MTRMGMCFLSPSTSTQRRSHESKLAMDPKVLARDLQRRITALPVANTPAVRTVRREFSLALVAEEPSTVIKFARILLDQRNPTLRFVAYELVNQHKPTLNTLSTDQFWSWVSAWTAGPPLIVSPSY
jgi:hypothetical protein